MKVCVCKETYDKIVVLNVKISDSTRTARSTLACAVKKNQISEFLYKHAFYFRQ